MMKHLFLQTICAVLIITGTTISAAQADCIHVPHPLHNKNLLEKFIPVPEYASPATALSLDPYFTNTTNPVIEVDHAGTLANRSASARGYSGDRHLNENGDVTGGYTFDYYSFSVGTGPAFLELHQTIAFDIDFAYATGLDTVLALYDTDGITVLDYNDDCEQAGPGDLLVPFASTLNPFFTYEFDTPGTYFIRVGEFSPESKYGGELMSEGSYQLHVSTLITPPAAVPVPSSLFLIFAGLGCLASVKRKTA